MNTFTQKATGKIMNYEQYTSWVADLVKYKQTSGSVQSETLIDFTLLNQRRMNRINKTLKLQEGLVNQLKNSSVQQWWVITEAWCGDSAQCLPAIAKMAEASQGKITLNIISRDENPELMNEYLTNGGAAIPKLVAFDNENEQELFTFGPRPEPAKQFLLDWKKQPEGKSWEDFEKELHTWYAKDRSNTIQQEFVKLTSSQLV